jgi:hypothetical protein
MPANPTEPISYTFYYISTDKYTGTALENIEPGMYIGIEITAPIDKALSDTRISEISTSMANLLHMTKVRVEAYDALGEDPDLTPVNNNKTIDPSYLALPPNAIPDPNPRNDIP